MSTRRDDLFDAIAVQLALIKIANGYNTDIATNEDDTLKSPDDLNEEDFPAAYVLDTDESKDNADLDEQQNRLEFIIVGYVRDGDSFSALQAKRRAFQQDVERAVFADRLLGKTYTVDMKLESIKTDKGTIMPFAIFDMTISITYWQSYGTP